MPKATRRGVAQLHRTVSARAHGDRYCELRYDPDAGASWGQVRSPRRPIRWTDRGARVALLGVCLIVAIVALAVCVLANMLTGSV